MTHSRTATNANAFHVLPCHLIATSPGSHFLFPINSLTFCHLMSFWYTMFMQTSILLLSSLFPPCDLISSFSFWGKTLVGICSLQDFTASRMLSQWEVGLLRGIKWFRCVNRFTGRGSMVIACLKIWFWSCNSSTPWTCRLISCFINFVGT